MNVDLSARIFAPTQQHNLQTGKPAASTQADAGGFMTVLTDVQGETEAETAETGDTRWIPWTEEELANLACEGLPEWEIQEIREQTFPEVAAERWMRIIAPFLNEATLPDAKVDYIAAGRAKCPFLDWVLSGKDPVEFFRQPGKLSTPLHEVIDGSTTTLMTAVASPVTLAASTGRGSTATGSRSAASLGYQEPVSSLLATEAQLDLNSALTTQKVAPPVTEPDNELEQRANQFVELANKEPDAQIKPFVAAARNLETDVVPIASRETDAAARIPATPFTASVPEPVEASRAQSPGSKSVLVASTVPAAAESQHTESGVRPSATPAVPQNTDLFMSELAERIHVQVRQGGNDIRIQLKPANLGHVEITAQTGAEGVVARIVTESSAVKQYLENNLHVLEQALVDQGLRMDRIDVVAQSYLDARQSSAQSDSQYGGSRHAADAGGGDAPAAAAALPGEDVLADTAFRPAIGPNSTFHTVA